MKVSKRDVSIVMVLLGVIALFCVYQFNYRKAVSKAESLQGEINTMTAENNELLQINEQDLENEMTRWQNELVEMIQKYPSQYRYDDLIMYLYDLEQTEEYGVHFYEYLMVPSIPLDGYVGKFRDRDVMFASVESTVKAEFTNDSYDGCKKMLSSIFEEYLNRVPKSFKTITLQYDNYTGVVQGEILFNTFSVTDYGMIGQKTNYPQAEVVIPPVRMGVECVFGPTVTPVPTLEAAEETTPQP